MYTIKIKHDGYKASRCFLTIWSTLQCSHLNYVVWVKYMYLSSTAFYPFFLEKEI